MATQRMDRDNKNAIAEQINIKETNDGELLCLILLYLAYNGFDPNKHCASPRKC